MKNKIYNLIKAILFIICVFSITPKSFAYNYETHALLTKETADFFNSKCSQNIPPELERYLIDGSRREDDIPRWLNHFYDPVYQRGISYDGAIDPLFQILQVVGAQPKSKDWAVDSNLQSTFFYKIASKIKPATVASILTAEETNNIKPLNEDADFTWNRALKFYVSGEKEKAMFALGHVLHLIQDVSVPDHTRNDPHTEDSIYEKSTQKYTLNNPDKSLTNHLNQEAKPENISNLEQVFDELSTYSNNNFYSKDTVGINSGYSSPTPCYFGRYNGSIYSYGFSEKDKYGDFPIILGSGLIGIQSNSLIDDEIIQSAYWTRLSTKSVTYSAGVIDLFFKEAERLKNSPEFTVVNKSFFAEIAEAVGGFFVRLGNVAKDAFSDMFSDPGKNIVAEIPAKEDGEEKEKRPLVYVDKISVFPGSVIIESGSGFIPNSAVTMFFLTPSDKTISIPVTADSEGNYSYKYSVPYSTDLGVYHYWAEYAAGLTTDRVKFQVIKIGDEKPALKAENAEKTASAETEKAKKKDENNEFPEIIISKECSFLGSGASSSPTVVINEVAWMGSTKSSSAEWIELRNFSNSEADISGWWLIDKAEQIKAVLPNRSKISPGGFYLLERGDDDTVPGILTDIVYSGGLSNTKEGLRLLNPDCVIEDEVFADPDWPAGNSTARKTMERKSDLSGWHTSELVDGTPKQQNSAGIINAVSANQFSSSGSASPPAKTIVPSCPQSGLPNPSQEIVINEVAWAGDAILSSNEWMELYNPGESAISLNGWQMLDKTEDIKVIFENTDAIPAKGYFLLMRGSVNFISGISPDKFYSGAINNSDETLRLFNSSCVLVDEIKDTGDNWKNIGGSASPEYRTAEKSAGGTWRSYSGQTEAIMGTPKAENSPKTSDPDPNPDPAEESDNNSSWGSRANKLVISEIMPGTADDINNEFIELYNPTENDISLDGWSLKKKAAPTSEAINLISNDSGLFDGKSISPQSFFLIASQQYSGDKIPDVKYSQNSNFLAGNGDVIVFYDERDEPAIIVEYGSIEKGKSWERKAFSEGVCFRAANDWEFSGNGCEADPAVLWDGRELPKPQNSASLPEPRNKPVWPFGSSEISAAFNFEKMAADFLWPSFAGIARISEEGKTIWSGIGSDGKKSVRLYELNKNHLFTFNIVDEDGLASSEKADFSVNAPRIITDFSLYSATRRDFDWIEKERLLIEFSWDKYPFLPRDLSLLCAHGEPPYPNYKIMVFYKNMDVPDDPFLVYENPSSAYAQNVAPVCYHGEDNSYECVNSLIMADVPGLWIPNAPNSKAIRYSYYFDEGDNRLTLPVGADILPGDYLTVGYYGFYRMYLGGASGEEGQKTFALIAKDNTKIMFSEAVPAHLPPNPPKNMVSDIIVAADGMKLVIRWEPSTDPDTPDFLIGYEISYDGGVSWKKTASGEKIPAVSGETHNIMIRAFDDFGLRSEILSGELVVPVPIGGALRDTWEVVMNRTLGQSFSGRSSPISGIVLDLTPSNPGTEYLVLYDFDTNAQVATFSKIFEANEVGVRGEYSFMSATPFLPDASKRYIFASNFPVISPVAVWGSATDTITDGNPMRNILEEDKEGAGPLKDLYYRFID